MKILLFLLITSGINYASTYKSDLLQDLREIADLLPSQDLFKIFDSGMQNGSVYINSVDFSDGLFLLSRHPSVRQIKKYLDSNGVNVMDLLYRVLKNVEQKPLPKKSKNEDSGRKSLKFKTFVDLAYSVKQTDNVVSLVIYKTATSKAFRKFYDLVSTMDYNKVYADMMKIKKFENMVIDLNSHGINTLELWKAFSYLFGWNKTEHIISLEEYEIEENSIEEDQSPLFVIVRQFLNLIPKEKFIFLYRGLMASPIFQEIVKFIGKQQYLNIIDELDKNVVIGDFFDYLKDKGASIEKILELLIHRLGFVYTMNKIPSEGHELEPCTYSLYRFFEMTKQLLPTNDIKKMSIELLDSSKDYREFHEKAIAVAQNPSVELFFENLYDLRNTAMQYGFSSCRIFNMLFAIFGIDYELPIKGKEFSDGIYEFIDLIPKNSYLELFYKHKNDLTIWRLFSYLKDKNFIVFATRLFASTQIQSLSSYLIKSYVPVKLIIIDLLDRIGLLQWFMNSKHTCGADFELCEGSADPNADNIVQFVKERMNLFPVKDMLILFHSKLLNSHHFQNLYLVVSQINVGDLFKKIVDDQVIRSFFVGLTKLGYNFRHFMEKLSQLFGWGKITAIDVSLNQTIENYDDLLYRKELFKIINKYPNEVQQIKDMFKNSAFLNTFNLFLNVEQIRNIITWMENLNVPVMQYINSFTTMNKTSSYHIVLDTELKWVQFQSEIRAFLVKNNIFAFSVEQKYNSIEFHALLEKLYALKLNMFKIFSQHPQFHFVMDKLLAANFNFVEGYLFLEKVLFDYLK